MATQSDNKICLKILDWNNWDEMDLESLEVGEGGGLNLRREEKTRLPPTSVYPCNFSSQVTQNGRF